MAANGRLRADELVTVSGAQLNPVTARAFTRMAAACRVATGVTLDIVNGSGGYRDIASQEALWANRAYYAALRPPISIARPGNSTHGLGTALDLTTTCFTKPVQAWLRAHCREYGFALPPSNDPRHFAHNGTTTGPATGGDSIPIPATPNARRPLMSITRHRLDGTGEFIMYASPAGVSLSRELSGAPQQTVDKEVAIAQTLRVLNDLPPAIPFYKEDSGSWLILNRLANAIAGMPIGFPLSPTKPFTASAATIDYDELARAVNDDAARRLAQ